MNLGQGRSPIAKTNPTFFNFRWNQLIRALNTTRPQICFPMAKVRLKYCLQLFLQKVNINLCH